MKRGMSGFTLTEIMIATVILAVIAGLSMPAYFRTVEQSRINEARTTLGIIHMGEKIYKLDNGTFWTGSASVADINDDLNVDISPQYYTTFTFTSFGPGPAFVNGYRCTVNRNGTQGGDPTWFYRFSWDNSTATLTKERCTPGCVTE